MKIDHSDNLSEIEQIYLDLDINIDIIPKPKKETFEEYASNFVWPVMFYPSINPLADCKSETSRNILYPKAIKENA